MRSPFSFISSSARVVTLDMLALQLSDFPPPEVAVGQLRMGNRQIRVTHGTSSIAHDVEIERSWPPTLTAFSAPLGFDRPAMGQERPRVQGRFQQHHFVPLR